MGFCAPPDDPMNPEEPKAVDEFVDSISKNSHSPPAGVGSRRANQQSPKDKNGGVASKGAKGKDKGSGKGQPGKGKGDVTLQYPDSHPKGSSALGGKRGRKGLRKGTPQQ